MHNNAGIQCATCGRCARHIPCGSHCLLPSETGPLISVERDGSSLRLLLWCAAQVRGLVMTGDFFFANVQVKVWAGTVEDVPTTFLEPASGAFWVGCIYGRKR